MGLIILVVEDFEWDAEVIQESLLQEQPDAHVEVVSSGEEALERLKDTPRPHFVIMDQKLSGSQYRGVEVLAHIRQTQGIAHLPVILFSSSGAKEDVSEAWQNGCTTYVRKAGDLEPYQEAVRLIARLFGRMTVHVEDDDV